MASASPGPGVSGFCTRCGNSLQPGAKFCPKCGSAISGGLPHPTGPTLVAATGLKPGANEIADLERVVTKHLGGC